MDNFDEIFARCEQEWLTPPEDNETDEYCDDCGELLDEEWCAQCNGEIE